MNGSLLSGLIEEYVRADESLRRDFDRSLPFQDAAFDRWERARRLGFGEGASIYNSALVFGKVTVGEHTWVGPNALLDGGVAGLSIGSWCAISAGVQIYAHHNVRRFLSGGRLPTHVAPIAIGDCCFVGAQSIIDPGVTIGDHCLVACNSFVNRDVPAFTIVGGSPARKLGEVELVDGHVRLRFHRDGGE